MILSSTVYCTVCCVVYVCDAVLTASKHRVHITESHPITVLYSLCQNQNLAPISLYRFNHEGKKPWHALINLLDGLPQWKV